MMTATYKSRISPIAAALPTVVGAPIKNGTERIAKTAAANAPDRPPPFSGLPESIEAKADSFSYGPKSGFAGVAGAHGFETPIGGVISADSYGVWAAWYWRFLEFGTTDLAPRPFMLPAAEVEMPTIVSEVQAVLKAL